MTNGSGFGGEISPTKSTESIIIQLWKNILERDNISPQDRFLALGGDSLQAVEFLCRIQDLYQRPIRMQEFVEHDSVQSFAAFLVSAYKNVEEHSQELLKEPPSH